MYNENPLSARTKASSTTKEHEKRLMTRACSRTARAKCAVCPRIYVCMCVCVFCECVERYLVASVGISNLT